MVSPFIVLTCAFFFTLWLESDVVDPQLITRVIDSGATTLMSTSKGDKPPLGFNGAFQIKPEVGISKFLVGIFTWDAP